MKGLRPDAMEQYILHNERVTIAQLQQHFDVSVNTLRRDLRKLEKRGHVVKVYGGAMAHAHGPLKPMPERFHSNVPEKRRIGELAAGLIPDGATIFVDSGSTACNIIRSLENRKALTLVTHSLTALNEAARLSGLNLISLGGIYNSSVDAFAGGFPCESIRNLSVQIAVMAASGISIRHGLSNNTCFEAELKREAVKNRKTSCFWQTAANSTGKPCFPSAPWKRYPPWSPTGCPIPGTWSFLANRAFKFCIPLKNDPCYKHIEHTIAIHRPIGTLPVV